MHIFDRNSTTDLKTWVAVHLQKKIFDSALNTVTVHLHIFGYFVTKHVIPIPHCAYVGMTYVNATAEKIIKTSFKSIMPVFLQMTAEAILRLVNDPVLPFYPLDIALDVQNKLKGTADDDDTVVSTAVMIICHVIIFH